MVIGLMGGVGSGKSTVLDYLEENYGHILFSQTMWQRKS